MVAGGDARSEIRGIPRGARFCEGAGTAFGALTLMVVASLAPESVTIRTPCCSLAAWRVTDSTHAPAAMDRRGDGGVSAPAGVAARGVRTRPGVRRPLLGGSWLAGLSGVVVVVGCGEDAEPAWAMSVGRSLSRPHLKDGCRCLAGPVAWPRSRPGPQRRSRAPRVWCRCACRSEDVGGRWALG